MQLLRLFFCLTQVTFLITFVDSLLWTSISNSAHLGSVKESLEEASKGLAPLKTDLTSRIDRSRVPLEWSVYDDGIGVSVRVLSLPSGCSSGFTSRRGDVFIKALYGTVQCVELSIDTEEEDGTGVQDGFIVTGGEDADDTEEEDGTGVQDGFIVTGGEDDCVCRGGICPRRQGCKFWVEHMARKAAIKLKGFKQPSELISSTSFRHFKRDISGPYELTSVSGAAAHVEVVFEGMERGHNAPDITYYHILKALEDRQGAIRVQAMPTAPPGTIAPSFMGLLSL